MKFTGGPLWRYPRQRAHIWEAIKRNERGRWTERSIPAPTNHVFQTQSQTVPGNNANIPDHSFSPARFGALIFSFANDSHLLWKDRPPHSTPTRVDSHLAQDKTEETADAVEGFHSGGENENEFTELYET